MILFILSGKNEMNTTFFNLVGTWEVVVSVEDKTVALVSNEFIIFDSDKVYNYKNNTSVPYISSKYEIDFDDEVVLKLTDISRKYVIDSKGENCINLYETPSKHICLIRRPNENLNVGQLDLIGKWNVTYRNTDVFMDEVLEFNESELADYRNGAPSAYLRTSYSWISNDCFTADELGKTMKVYSIQKDKIILLETDTGDIWELNRVG